MIKTNKNKKLLENTIMLYILTFSNYFFQFIAIPHQTRVLGPEIYGKIGFALAFATYFKLLFDFGFILSATEDVSKSREDKSEVAKILTSVNILKIILILFSTILLIVLINTVDVFKGDKLLYILYFAYIAIDAFQPDFLYRGLEMMRVITIRNVLIKLFFTIMIFFLLKNQNQYYLVPILNIIGSVLSIVAVYYHVFKKLNIKFIKVDIEKIKYTFNKSKIFFLSRIASTVYGATNTFILGFIYPTGNMLGYYSTSDKLLTAGRSALSPISDSVYPYMVKNKDFKLIKKILKIFMPIIIIGCTVIGIFAEPVCVLLFGNEYAGSANILRLMLPIIAITLPSYLLGFPTMTPLGLEKQANLSVIIGSVYHAIVLVILLIISKINVYSICAVTITTEIIILLSRIYYIRKHTKNTNKILWKNESNEK